MQVPGAPIWLPGGGAGSSGDDLRAPKSTLGVLGRRFRVLGGRFGATLNQKFNFWENFGHENRFRWKIYESGNTKYEIRNTKHEIRNTNYDVRNTKYEIRNMKYEIRNTKHEIRNTKYEKKTHFSSNTPSPSPPHRSLELDETASAHLVCKTRSVEAHFQSNCVEKTPSGSAAVAAGHLNPPTPWVRRGGRLVRGIR